MSNKVFIIELKLNTEPYQEDILNKRLELAPNVNTYDKGINRLSRKLDRSRRSTNPGNYNKNGTIKKGIKFNWVRSKSYIRALYSLKELFRLKKEYVNIEHNKLTNEILSLGDEVSL